MGGWWGTVTGWLVAANAEEGLLFANPKDTYIRRARVVFLLCSRKSAVHAIKVVAGVACGIGIAGGSLQQQGNGLWIKQWAHIKSSRPGQLQTWQAALVVQVLQRGPMKPCGQVALVSYF